jgi:CTP synthase
VLGLEGANSQEMDENTPHPVIHLMEDQKHVENKGGTMRLGAYNCDIKAGTLAEKVYGATQIQERHRHRYEFNNDYLKQYEKAGMIASGLNPENKLVEIVELPSHPFFIAGQFHPELKSTVVNPHPLFVSFVAAANKRANS